MVTTRIDPTNLDFNEIKKSLKQYLSTKDEYKDFDFEGSNINILLDHLAYNTHLMALNAYINFNETNLESAQLRGNVVTRATALGYKPRSKIASKAKINILITNPIGTNTVLTLPKGTRLTTTINDIAYPFVITEAYTSTKSIDGNFRFNSIQITQGIMKKTYFIYDERDEYPVFIIPDKNVDTNTLKVNVKEHDSATSYRTYTRFNKLNNVTQDSQVYFIDENYDGYFFISFGDDVIGKSLSNNNVIEIEYVSTKGIEANGARIFSLSDTIGGNNNVTITTTENSNGGLEQEDIETIRFNSKRLFAAQDRCVTESDYLAIISDQFDDIETIAVYGGENLPTPQYGKTYISIKPFERDNLNISEKDEIINKILKPKQVGSITPILIDPDYTNISLKVNYKYDSNKTSLSTLDINNAILNTITQYNSTVLQKFSGVFRFSNLVGQIDKTNNGITSNTINVLMYKEITPSNNSTNFFELNFTNASYNINTTDFTVTSSAVIINGTTYFIGDRPTNVSGKRQLFIYRDVNNNRQILLNDVGYLIQNDGKMVLKNFTPDTTDKIKVFVRPNSLDLSPKYNQLLRIGSDEVSIAGEIDTIAIGGSGLGAINFRPTPINQL